MSTKGEYCHRCGQHGHVVSCNSVVGSNPNPAAVNWWRWFAGVWEGIGTMMSLNIWRNKALDRQHSIDELRAAVAKVVLERDGLKAERDEAKLWREAAEAELEAWKRGQQGKPTCFNCGVPCDHAAERDVERQRAERAESALRICLHAADAALTAHYLTPRDEGNAK